MAKLLTEVAPVPDQGDKFSYWTFRDLAARRIVSTRHDLHRKQHLFGFPRPVILTGGQGANAIYRIVDVKKWLLEREALAAKNSAPELKPGSRPRGRPRRSEHQAAQTA